MQVDDRRDIVNNDLSREIGNGALLDRFNLFAEQKPDKSRVFSRVK